MEVQVDKWAKIRLQHWRRRGILATTQEGYWQSCEEVSNLPNYQGSISKYWFIHAFASCTSTIGRSVCGLYTRSSSNPTRYGFYFLWLTGTRTCPISQHARRLQMLLEQLICSSKKLCVCMECQSPSPLTGIPSSLVTFGKLWGSVFTLSRIIAAPIILKLMARKKWLIAFQGI